MIELCPENCLICLIFKKKAKNIKNAISANNFFCCFFFLKFQRILNK